MFERDLSDDAKIDKHRIDKAAEEQTDMYSFWAQRAADLRKEEEGKEVKLKFEKATKATNLRATLAKSTEGTISEGVATDPKILALEEELVSVRHQRNLADAAVRTMDHRKSMIEVLARLWAASYFGDPKTNTRGDELAQGQRNALNRNRD